MTKDELYEKLTELIGPSFMNYPICVEWNIRVLKYLEEQRKQDS